MGHVTEVSTLSFSAYLRRCPLSPQLLPVVGAMAAVSLRIELPAYEHSFELSVSPDTSIGQVKVEISRRCPGQPRPDGQRLISKGRMLSDDQRIADIWNVRQVSSIDSDWTYRLALKVIIRLASIAPCSPPLGMDNRPPSCPTTAYYREHNSQYLQCCIFRSLLGCCGSQSRQSGPPSQEVI